MRKLNFLSAAMMISLTAIGQASRVIDMEIVVNSPVEGGIYAEGDAMPVNIYLKNNGPHDLQAGDSLFLISTDVLTTLPTKIDMIILEQDIMVAQQVEVYDGAYRFNGMPEDWELTEFCAQFADDPSTQITLPDGSPVTVSYTDPVPGNNGKCRSITVGGGSNAIAPVIGKGKLSLYPNPATTVVYIPLTPGTTNAGRITISDITGRKVLERSYPAAQLMHKRALQVAVADLNTGVHLVEWQQGGMRRTGKVHILR